MTEDLIAKLDELITATRQAAVPAAVRQHAIAHALANNAHVARAVLLQQLDWSLWGSPRQSAGELHAGASYDRPGPMQINTTAGTKIDMARRRAWERRTPYREMLSPPEHIPLRWYIDHADCTQILADCVATLLQDPDIDTRQPAPCRPAHAPPSASCSTCWRLTWPTTGSPTMRG